MIVKFPYSAARRIHSRKPRRSKNGTPEEREAAGLTTKALSDAVMDDVITLADRRPAHSSAQRLAVEHAPLLERIAALPRADLEFLSAKIRDASTSRRVANARGECVERENRHKQWRAAESRVHFLHSLRKLGWAAGSALKWGKLPDAKPYADLDKGGILLDRYRAAVTELLLTPVSKVAELKKKKRMRADSWHSYSVHDNEQPIDALIARDEAWLKANAPVRRKAARS